MKKTPLILSIIALVGVVVLFILNFTGSKGQASVQETQTTEQSGAIAYFYIDKVIEGYDMANDLNSVVETKINSINEEVNRRGNKLQTDVNAYQEKINKGLYTRSVAEVQAQKLQEEEIAFQNYANEKQIEINEELTVLQNQIADAINAYVLKYNEEMKYDLIISTSGSIIAQPVVTGSAALDITEALIAGLNEEYIQTKKEK